MEGTRNLKSLPHKYIDPLRKTVLVLQQKSLLHLFCPSTPLPVSLPLSLEQQPVYVKRQEPCLLRSKASFSFPRTQCVLLYKARSIHDFTWPSMTGSAQNSKKFIGGLMVTKYCCLDPGTSSFGQTWYTS